MGSEALRRYSYFHALILSFFSKSLYQDVGRKWRGTGLAYLLVILALVWIPTVIKGHLGLKAFVENDAPGITQQIPAITITNGKASTDAPLPHLIKDPKSGDTIAIIDTRQAAEPENSESIPLVLTQTKLVTHKDARETRIYDLSSVGRFFIDRAKVEGWLATGKRWFFPILYPVGVLFSFIFRAIQILIYALIGLLFSRLLNVNLDYKALMRLAAVAITPMLVLDLILEFVPVHIPFFALLGIAIELGYLFFAVKVNAETEMAPVYQPPPAYPNIPGSPE
jgi:hypothetical protein